MPYKGDFLSVSLLVRSSTKFEVISTGYKDIKCYANVDNRLVLGTYGSVKIIGNGTIRQKSEPIPDVSLP